MANHTSLSMTQATALLAFLEATMPESLDELAELVGNEHAFRLTLLRDRLREKFPEEEDSE